MLSTSTSATHIFVDHRCCSCRRPSTSSLFGRKPTPPAPAPWCVHDCSSQPHLPPIVHCHPLRYWRTIGSRLIAPLSSIYAPTQPNRIRTSRGTDCRFPRLPSGRHRLQKYAYSQVCSAGAHCTTTLVFRRSPSSLASFAAAFLPQSTNGAAETVVMLEEVARITR